MRQKNRRSECALLILGSLSVATVLAGGNPSDVYEVASIKHSAVGDRRFVVGSRFSPDGLIVSHMRMKDCLALAFELSPSQIIGPSWIDSESFDISARAAGPVSRADQLVMLRNLLVERFHINYSSEERETKVYALVVAKNGPRLKEASMGPDAVVGMRPNGEGGWETDQISLSSFVRFLNSGSVGLDRPVVDKTDLGGLYKLKLSYAAIPDRTSAQLGDEESSDFPSIFAAIQSQLGLRLEPRTELHSTVIIKSANRDPAAN